MTRAARLSLSVWACGLALLFTVAACGGGNDGNPSGAGGASAAPPSPRPAAWAQPLTDQLGLPNLHRVDDGLYRGAQPEDEGFDALKAMGIKTVINLRTFSSDRKACGKSGLEYEKIAMQAWRDNDSDVEAFLRMAIDAERAPIFVHCLHGADRTGMVVAVYRVVVQGWPKEEALREMTLGEFGFHEQFGNLLEYVKELDVEEMRQRIGLPAPGIAP